MTTRPVQQAEQLQGQRTARTQFGRALYELGIGWIAAHSPQAKGRIERLFGTLQDRLVKQMRLAGVATGEEANRYWEEVFLPQWEQRFRSSGNLCVNGGPLRERMKAPSKLHGLGHVD